ncbi:MAG TPA: type II toxin-antitoxin system PemK/MazF family toxin, partial [Acidimicrobiia bacterium]|nr:type II toxin-antitoxin system PemK/MazF family toxin [Acidimicrobiia bacterium]
MLTSGDVLLLNLGLPAGHEAGLRRPAVLVTAQRVLNAGPDVIHVVPLTTTIRGLNAEVTVEADLHNDLSENSAAQCRHIRAVTADRIDATLGNVGPVALSH